VLFILEITQIIYDCVAPSSGFNRRNGFSRLLHSLSIDNRFHKKNGGNSVELWIVERLLLTLFTPFMRVSVHAVRECQLTPFIRSTCVDANVDAYVDADYHRQLFSRAALATPFKCPTSGRIICIQRWRRPPPYGLTSAPTRIAFDSNRFELIRIDSTWIAFFEIFRIFSSTRIGKIKIHIHLNCDIFG
jgi:hypothetical protein